MSATPVYMGTICVARAQISVANTNVDGTGTLATPEWGGTGGASTPPPTDWVMKRIIIGYTGDPADSVVRLFTTDGSTIQFLTDIDIGNPAAVTTTSTAVYIEQPYFDYGFPATWDLRFAITVAPTTGVVVATAFCERA